MDANKRVTHKQIHKLLVYTILLASLASCVSQRIDTTPRFSKGKRGSWRNSNKGKRAPIQRSTLLKRSESLSQRQRDKSNKKITYSKKLSTKEYVELYKDIAIKEMEYAGIPASITLAQGILESGNGNSTLAKKSNNHFGIKCHKSWKGERVYHDDDALQECFRKYEHPYDSYRDHTDFLTRGRRYQFLFDLDINDYEAWARGLKKAGYATAPDYAEKLISLIDRFELYQYYGEFTLASSGSASKKTPKQPPSKKTSNVQKTGNAQKLAIQKENQRRYILVKSGDTFYNVSTRSGISVSNLKSFNPRSSSTLSLGQKLYLDPETVDSSPALRQTQTARSHTVSKGDTLYSIARKYQVSLGSLRQANKLSENQSIQIGQQLTIPAN